MSKYDDFFKSETDSELKRKILSSAEPELRHLRNVRHRRLFLTFLVPAFGVAVVAFIALKTNLLPIFDEQRREMVALERSLEVDDKEILISLLDDEDTLDVIDDLGLLQDLDNMSQLSDEELAG